MTDNHVHMLFESPLLRIENYHCNGAKHGDEEATSHHEIVFPRSGTFARRNTQGMTVADVTQAVFFNRSQPYQVNHPHRGGDVSTVIVIEHHTLIDLLRSRDVSVVDRMESPFHAGSCPAELSDRIALHRILGSAKKAHDPLEVEESSLMMVASVWQHAVHTRPIQRWRSRQQTVREQNEIVSRVRFMLGECYRQKLSLDQLAREVYISPYHLCRIFKRETGISIHRYLQRIRLLNALEHLAAYPNDDLTPVALNHGFSSHSHFSAFFQREFGVTPSAFCRTVTTDQLRELSRELTAR